MIAGKSSIHELQNLLVDDMKHVDDVIQKHIQSPLTLMEDVCRHLIFAGGKRLRPLLTLACASLFQDSKPRAFSLAAMIEFIHTATLLHDDVVDESKLRRGIPTANDTWGNKISILVGDFLFTQAFALMVADGDQKILKLMCETTQKLAEGEIRQLQNCVDLSATLEDSLQVSAHKTAALFGASCLVGGYAVNQDLPALYEFGLALGMIFQLVDDLEDYTLGTRGKTQGEDFYSGKITLPVLVAYHHGNSEEKAFWTRTIQNQKFNDQDLTLAVGLIQKHLPTILELIKIHETSALLALESFPTHPYKDLLKGIVQELMERTTYSIANGLNLIQSLG